MVWCVAKKGEPKQKGRAGVRAKKGPDQDEGGLIPSFGQSALEKGLLSQDDIDTRLAVLLRMRMRLGHFDPLGPMQAIPESALCSEATKANCGRCMMR